MSNLYKISQNINNDYDTYDSAVVVADSEQEAQKIHPSQSRGYEAGGWPDSEEGYWELRSWCQKPEQVNVQFIGLADPSLNPGTVVIASYNAG